MYLECKTIEEALYERDRFVNVNWDWDLYVLLQDTANGYIHIDLPPFDKEPSYITVESEYWRVRDKGAKQRYRGVYHSEEEAKRVANIYDANITYVPVRYRVNKKFNGKEKFFGRYKTWEEAEERVRELKQNNWSK